MPFLTKLTFRYMRVIEMSEGELFSCVRVINPFMPGGNNVLYIHT